VCEHGGEPTAAEPDHRLSVPSVAGQRRAAVPLRGG
jgi:hypothetical protein